MTKTTTQMTYKEYDFEDCVIRYTSDEDMYIKFKGGKEFKTSRKDSKIATDAELSGKTITKHQYDNY